MHFKDWQSVPSEYKKTVYPALFDYFNLNMYKDGDADQWAGIELRIIAECQSRYSSRKNKLHDHFKAVGGVKDVDRAKSCPPKNYDSRKWVDLIDILFTDLDYIRRSNANTENRKKQRYPSYHGSQSYAQRRYIEVRKTVSFT
ncbi:hypothetical protein Hanom_Chr07g00662181 [Helianthus anomalus]